MIARSGPSNVVLKGTILATVAVAVCLAVSTAVLAYFYVDSQTQNDSTSATTAGPRSVVVDDSPEAVESVKIIKKFLDQSVAPCEDFYSFSCGQFVKDHKGEEGIVPGRPELPTDQMLLRSLATLTTMMETFNHTDDADLDNYKTKLAHSWKTCVKAQGQSKPETMAQIRLKLDVLGGWPITEKLAENSTSSWNDLSAVLFRELDIQSLLNLDFYSDYISFNIRDSHIYVSPDKYEEFLNETVDLVRSIYPDYDVDYVEIDESVLDMLDLIKQLRDQWASPIAINLKLKSFSNDFPGIQLKNYATMYLGSDAYDAIENMFTVRSWYNSTELMKLSEILSATNPETIKNLILFQFVTSMHHGMALRHFKQLRNIMQRRSPVQEAMADMMEFQCFESICATQLGSACVAAYFNGNFDTAIPTANDVDNVRSEFAILAGYVRRTYLKMFGRAAWMDSDLRHKVVRLFDEMKYWIVGLPKIDEATNAYYSSLHIRPNDSLATISKKSAAFLQRKKRATVLSGLPIDPSDELPSFIDALFVNAFYSSAENIYRMLPGMLQHPFYDSFTAPMSVKFGTYVTIIGHEVGHSVDIEGIQSMVTKTETRETIKEMGKCISDYYSKYTDDDGKQIDGELVIRESSSDLIGLRAAYLSFKTWQELEGDINVDKRLKGLEDYSMEQIMYIKFAQNFCASKNTFFGDVHPPDKFRVLGTTHNDPEFHRLFGCVAPEKRCEYFV